MFDCGTDKNSSEVNSISVLVLLPRYLVDTWRELREAIRQNKAAIDDMVRVRVEKELCLRGLSTPFRLFSLPKCTLRADYILEYHYSLKPV